MNNRLTDTLKNISYSFGANLLSTILSFVLIMIVPKVLGVTEYGYWQLYTFYVSYVGFFHFGWADGIYLRYGGEEYEQLDKSLFHSQYWLLTGLEIIVMLIICFGAWCFVPDPSKLYIIIAAAINCVLLLPRTLLQFILQSTGRIKEYAKNIIIEKIIYTFLTISMILVGVREFQYLLLADIIAKIYTMISIAWVCKDIVSPKAKRESIFKGIPESIENIRVGLKLMFSNIASSLIIGIVRFSIERVWNVETFGKVSLAMTVSNLLMVFINAVSVALYPMIKRTPEEKLSDNYNLLRTTLVMPILGILILYYPAKLIFSAWLPQYAESLNYMALMFPLCLYEAKMSMLINTYMKALRLEGYMLLVNMISVVLSFASTYFIVFTLKNLSLAVLSITLLVAFRCFIAEMILTRYINISIMKDVLLEFLLTAVFIFFSWYIRNWASTIIYTLIYVVYLIIKRNDIKNLIGLFKKNIKKSV